MTDKKFSIRDIADYYDQTEIHYRRGWNLSKSLALHYGYWDKNTKHLLDALRRMNERMAELANIKKGDYVLDAGCGVGGSAIYLAQHIGCSVKGITLSKKQAESATANAVRFKVSALTSFEEKDYNHTDYASETFDVIWALESSGTATDKTRFINEAYRMTKKGGRIVIGDVYRGKNEMSKSENLMLLKVLNGWAMSDVTTPEKFKEMLKQGGFSHVQLHCITPNIHKSAVRIFWGAISMFFIANAYKLYNPKVRYFAHNHYKALFWQYIALKKGLWNYYLITAVKS
jgi:cyclopropane fatty-acyl-phospholipid synthase-like methyltransferase